MHPQIQQKLKISLGPEAYASPNAKTTQKIAWTRSLCIPKAITKSTFRMNTHKAKQQNNIENAK